MTDYEAEFKIDHRLEPYKALPKLASEGLRAVLYLNGGAAVAMLSYLAAKDIALAPDMRWPMMCFVVGLTLAATAYVLAYVAQLRLFNELMGRADDGRHAVYVWMGLAAASLSIGAFCWCALSAAARFYTQ